VARLDNPELWAARIQEQLEGLARADRVSLDTGDPVPVEAEVDGERMFFGSAIKSGDTVRLQFDYKIDMEK
jgi:hypothetical protein